MPEVVLDTDEQAFVEAAHNILSSGAKAGEIVRRKMADDPEWPEKLAEKVPWLSAYSIRQFGRIGTSIHPKLFLSSSVGAQALKRMPYAIQEKYSVEPVPVLISKGEKLLIDIHNLTPDQTAQVFNGKEIRELPAQRAWIESLAVAKEVKPKRVDSPYRISSGKLIVMVAGTTFTRKELAKLLADMEP